MKTMGEKRKSVINVEILNKVYNIYYRENCVLTFLDNLETKSSVYLDQTYRPVGNLPNTSLAKMILVTENNRHGQSLDRYRDVRIVLYN